jgi:hypothetical protein
MGGNTGFFQAQRLPRGYISGFHVDQSTDRDHDLVITGGVCRSADNTRDCIPSWTTITKQGDAGFSEGDGGGLQQSGSDFAASTRYYIKLISKDSDPSVFDVVGSTSAVTAPSGWTLVRILDVIKTNSSSNMVLQRTYLLPGGALEHRLSNPVSDAAVNPGTSAVSVGSALTGVPQMNAAGLGGGRIFGQAELNDVSATGVTYAWVRGPNDDNEAASADNFDIEVSNATGASRRFFHFNVPFEGIFQYRLSASDADRTFTYRVRGYIFNRVVP